MSTATTLQIATDSSEATEALGAKLGANLRGGEVIELRSDVGGGKTTFVRGIARGMGSTDHVGSPSFTISRVYKGSRRLTDPKLLHRNGPTNGKAIGTADAVQELWLHHYDFYRLSEPGLMSQELSEVLTDPGAVVIVEWADIVEDVLPSPHAVIVLEATSESGRTFHFDIPANQSYLTEQLQ
jgi:tRNA threonylcarbamoyladenosine biosynthesis protein TsaE